MNHLQNISISSLIKSCLIAAFVLFALTPCVVKESVLQTFDLEYVKPANKTIVTPQNLLCVSAGIENQDMVHHPSIPDDTTVVPADDVYEWPSRGIISLVSDEGIFQPPSNDYPPKYILFKRLKIAIA